jgi:hypothetical protein
MSSSKIGPEQDPLERYYRVEEIEAAHWEGGKKKQSSLLQSQPGILKFLHFLLQKVADIIRQWQTPDILPLQENLRELVKIFARMQHQNLSQETLLLKHFCELWQKTVEYSIKMPSEHPLTGPLKSLIEEIETHPKESGRPLGYYLNDCAGQKWLPLPYIDLLQDLYHSHQIAPKSSLLARWTGMIDQILNSNIIT